MAPRAAKKHSYQIKKMYHVPCLFASLVIHFIIILGFPY